MKMSRKKHVSIRQAELAAEEEQDMLHEISAEQAENPLTEDELVENARIFLEERRNQPKKH